MPDPPTIQQPHFARFIGGTGRSGTSILAHMVGRHQDLVLLSEPRFIADPGGLVDLATGKVNLPEFGAKMHDTFLPRINDKIRYAPISVEGPVLRPFVLDELLATAKKLASRAEQASFIGRAIFDHIARRCGVCCCLEKTPNTVEVTDILRSLFGEYRYVHIIRDPRSTAASMFDQAWGPTTVDQFIARYQRQMTRAIQAMNELPDSWVKIVRLEDLVAAPDVTFNSVMHHFKLDVSDSLRDDALGILTMDKAHLDRWKEDLTPAAAARIEQACMPLHHLLTESTSAMEIVS